MMTDDDAQALFFKRGERGRVLSQIPSLDTLKRLLETAPVVQHSGAGWRVYVGGDSDQPINERATDVLRFVTGDSDLSVLGDCVFVGDRGGEYVSLPAKVVRAATVLRSI